LEVAQELIRILGKEKDIKITTVTSDYFKDIYYTERPFSEQLETKKLDLRKINAMRDWKIALKEYIETYYQGYL
jgi:dTDP-4-dehydrorhamnose reductase